MTPEASLLLNAITYVLVVFVAFKCGRDWDEIAGAVRRRRFRRRAGCTGMTQEQFDHFMEIMTQRASQ